MAIVGAATSAAWAQSGPAAPQAQAQPQQPQAQPQQSPQGSPALPGADAPSSSLLVNTPIEQNPHHDKKYEPHALHDVSLFAIIPPKPREFVVHDLVQIIVRETSAAKSSSDLKTKKEEKLDGKVEEWPDFNITDLLNLSLHAGDSSNSPAVKLDFTKDFQGEGDYERKDDLTARVTAEVMDVLPNGNLVLEARTYIKTDKEEQTMKVTGICRPDDVTTLNTINSNQIHDLSIEKVHKGSLKDVSQKGLLTKLLETFFAF
jgi:flagellar L-ring protein precursor FlgH